MRIIEFITYVILQKLLFFFYQRFVFFSGVHYYTRVLEDKSEILTVDQVSNTLTRIRENKTKTKRKRTIMHSTSIN